MTRESAKQEILSRLRCEELLEKSKGRFYCCPFCGSGTGNNNKYTGALEVFTDTNKYKCHACGEHGDVIDLYKVINNVSFNEALYQMADELGITIEHYKPTAQEDFESAEKKEGQTRPQQDEQTQGNNKSLSEAKIAQGGSEGSKMQLADYTPYYRECRERLKDERALNYLKSRGISTETAEAYYIGFDPAADPAQSNHPRERLIIPVTKYHFIGRATDGGNDRFAKMNSKGAPVGIFNMGALYAQDVREVFITEGVFDALSIIECGFDAISLNSTSNYKLLLKRLEVQRTNATLIVCLDNDEPGENAARDLMQGLNTLGISCIKGNICGGYKDPSEALNANKEEFINSLEKAVHETAPRPDNMLYYIDNLLATEISNFQTDIMTGYEALDQKAGGIYCGLYVLAALSSLGKTTFALNLAENIAQSGHDVIYFSLEQSRLEMVSKSLARRTVKIGDGGRLDFSDAVSSLSIRKGYLPPQVLKAAEELKRDISDRLSIIESNFSCDLSFIGSYIEKYIKANNERPVIFIDYLQIIQLDDDKGIRETVNDTITGLKRMSRDLCVPIFVISSVNRSNYLTPIDFESLKESGGIEFTADCIWGLQLACLNEELFDKKENIKKKRARIREAKAENPRHIELVCLKNRYGISSFKNLFKYYPANDLFVEDSAPVEFYINDNEDYLYSDVPKAGRKI